MSIKIGLVKSSSTASFSHKTDPLPPSIAMIPWLLYTPSVPPPITISRISSLFLRSQVLGEPTVDVLSIRHCQLGV